MTIDPFDSLAGAMQTCTKQAEDALKHRRVLAALVKSHIGKPAVRDAVAAFVRLHMDDIEASTQTTALMIMLKQIAPNKPANAKQLGEYVAEHCNGISQHWARNHAFGLLVQIGVVDAKEGNGFVWADLAAKHKAPRDAAFAMLTSVVKPAFPELYDEQRKLAAAQKAHDLAKQRQELLRKTAAMVASQPDVAPPQSNVKVIVAAVAAALFAGGVLIAKYGSAPVVEADAPTQEVYADAPAIDIASMLRANHPGFDQLPMGKQQQLIDEATAAFNH
jgi:hypothetical protein